MTTAKKTMLKNSRLCGTPLITGKVASTTGTAPRSPAHPRTSRSRALNRSKAVATNGGERPRHERDHQGDEGPFDQHVAEMAREDEQAKGQEEGDLGDPGQALVEGGDRPLGGNMGAAQRQPGQIDGQKAGAVDVAAPP